MYLGIHKYLLLFAFLGSFPLHASNEISFEVRAQNPLIKSYKKKLEVEPIHVFMQNPGFIFRIGAKSKKHFVLSEKKNNIFVLSISNDSVGQHTLHPKRVDKLATFIRFEIYKYFFGPNKLKLALTNNILTEASLKEYPVFIEDVSKLAKKDNGLREAVAKKENEDGEKASLDYQQDAIASSELHVDEENEIVEINKKSDGFRIKIGRFFDQKRFPLLISFGAVFGGAIRDDKNADNLFPRGAEMGLGAHFNSNWTFKTISRFQNAYDSRHEKVFSQRAIGLLIGKRIEQSPFGFYFGLAQEKLRYQGEEQSMMKSLLSASFSVREFFSLDLRQEFSLTKYDSHFNGIIGDIFLPVVVVSFGYSL